MATRLTGCGTALVTPFTRDGALDERRCGGWRGGRSRPASTSSCPCGTTGESPTLTDDERVRVVELVVAEARRPVPVLAGAGGYNTREVIASALRMKRAGADGILSVTPYYNKPTQEGLFQHYSAIAERGRAADRRLQRARPDRRATSRSRRSCASARSRTSSASRKRRAT